MYIYIYICTCSSSNDYIRFHNRFHLNTKQLLSCFFFNLIRVIHQYNLCASYHDWQQSVVSGLQPDFHWLCKYHLSLSLKTHIHTNTHSGQYACLTIGGNDIRRITSRGIVTGANSAFHESISRTILLISHCMKVLVIVFYIQIRDLWRAHTISIYRKCSWFDFFFLHDKITLLFHIQ